GAAQGREKGGEANREGHPSRRKSVDGMRPPTELAPEAAFVSRQRTPDCRRGALPGEGMSVRAECCGRDFPHHQTAEGLHLKGRLYIMERNRPSPPGLLASQPWPSKTQPLCRRSRRLRPLQQRPERKRGREKLGLMSS